MRNMRKGRLPLLAALLLAAALALGSWLTPEHRAERYAEAHRENLQADMDAFFLRGEPLRYDAGLETVNHWPGEHPMVEYLLPTLRPGYYGFYYSPDDVPLAFQNAAVPLEAAGRGWSWRAEGDNHGFTRRLSPRWYYFEAHF